MLKSTKIMGLKFKELEGGLCNISLESGVSYHCVALFATSLVQLETHPMVFEEMV